MDARRSVLQATVLGDFKQNLIGMMPRVAGFIMRRRRQTTIGQALAPVRLAFQRDAMAICTVRNIYLAPQTKEFRISDVG